MKVGTERAREVIVSALLRWKEERGDFPRAAEWQSGTRPDWCPSYDRVRNVFGGWGLAIEAAEAAEKNARDRIVAPPAVPGTVRGEIVGDEASSTEPSLVELAQRLEAAAESKREADDAYGEALLAFRGHELWRAALDDMP